MLKAHIQQMHSQILNFSMMLIERTIIVILIIIHLGGQWICFFHYVKIPNPLTIEEDSEEEEEEVVILKSE